MGNEFSPTGIEKCLHAVTGLADRRIVFIECDAIVKHELNIGTKIISRFVSENKNKQINK